MPGPLGHGRVLDSRVSVGLGNRCAGRNVLWRTNEVENSVVSQFEIRRD